MSDAHMFYCDGSPASVAAYQAGYLAGVAEGVQIGRQELARERWEAQQAHAARWPFPADQKVKSLRARRLREQPTTERRSAA